MIRSHSFYFVSQDLLTIVTFDASIDKDKKTAPAMKRSKY